MSERRERFHKHLTIILGSLAVWLMFGTGAGATAVSLITGSQIANNTITKDKLATSTVTALKPLAGAYYAVAEFRAQNVNPGAIREVACKSTSDVAISGGFQTLGVGGSPSHVSSSFPGRMNWTTKTPIDGRHDGWIVQFDVNWAPQNAKLWALCLPGQAYVPETRTFFETS